MVKKYDTLVYIGRFSPIHNGHLETFKLASQLCKQLIVIIGSSYGPRTEKNPWTFEERESFIVGALNGLNHNDTKGCQFIYEPSVDYLYNDNRWAKQIQDIVHKHNNDDSTIGIIGHYKDDSSFYLDMFPQWGKRLLNAVVSGTETQNIINGTDIRKAFFSYTIQKLIDCLPYNVYLDLYTNGNLPVYKELRKEKQYIDDYKQSFSKCPYPPIFVTTDAVVVMSGHILMVKRKSYPGQGQWALPGGFVNANTDKTLIDAMMRELREETKLKIPEPVLRGSIVNVRVFDAIGRSSRGRTITHAYHISLPDGELPKVKGGDDAEKARFIPLNKVSRSNCFEDHFEIISWFTGI
jgi:bifunctional NMN adenylyltransferase/nudix hydrolase